MAYDEGLARRIRELVAGEPGSGERKMFGGLAFLVGGNMAVALSVQCGILAHVDAACCGRLGATTPAEPMVMRGRELAGWLRVAAEHVGTEYGLRARADRGLGHVRSLPARR